MLQAISERIVISSVHKVAALVKSRKSKIGGVISLQTAPPDYKKPKDWHPPRLTNVPQIFLTVSDDAHHFAELPQGLELKYPPTKSHIAEAINFANNMQPSKNLLIHCHAGIFRSTAVALAIIASEYGDGKEMDALERLLSIHPRAIPSLPLVKIADDYLARDGSLLAAVMNNPRIAGALAGLEQFWRERAVVSGTVRLPLPPPVFVLN